MQTTNNLIKLSPMLRRPTVEFESKPVVVIPGDLWWYSPECLAIFTEILGDIRQNVWRHSPKCLRTFPGMFEDIPRNVWRYSLEYLATLLECLRRLPEMFGDIPRNVWGHSPECLVTFPGIKHSTYSPRSVPRSCIPGFIVVVVVVIFIYSWIWHT